MASVLLVPAGQIVSPLVPQTDYAVGPDFERFDGLTIPTTNPAAGQDAEVPCAGRQGGADYGLDKLGSNPRPGAKNQPFEDWVYTPGPIKGTVGTVQGQPLPANAGVFQTVNGQRGAYTPGKSNSIQFRKGVGQANQGAAQTTQLSQITDNPPVPGDLSSIIAGLG